MTVRTALLLTLACVTPAGVAAAAPLQEPVPKPAAQDVPTMEEARALLDGGDAIAAAKAFARIAKAQPENGNAAHMLGYCLHAAGELEAALEAHKAAAKFANVRGVALYNCACVYSMQGELDEAIAYLKKAHEAGWSNVDHIASDSDMDNLRSDARFKKLIASFEASDEGAQKEKEEAEKAKTKEVAYAQENTAVPTMQDARAKLDAGDPLGAAQAYAAIAKAEPENGQAHHMTGYTLHVAGELDAALEAHLAATKFESVRPVALYNVACVHALKGRNDAAFEYLGKARLAGFNQPDQLETDTDMDNLRADPRFAQILASMQSSGAATGLAALPAERRFDFWVGGWDTSVGGEVYGASTVERTLGGKGLRQTSIDGESGEALSESLYGYDAQNGRWKQVWMDRDGNHVVLFGGLQGGDMVMTMATMNGEAQVSGRSVFSNVTASGFDYEWQTSEDGGKTWYHGTNVRFARSLD